MGHHQHRSKETQKVSCKKQRWFFAKRKSQKVDHKTEASIMTHALIAQLVEQLICNQ